MVEWGWGSRPEKAGGKRWWSLKFASLIIFGSTVVVIIVNEGGRGFSFKF